MKSFIKNNFFLVILTFFGIYFVHWYLSSQQVIPDIAISFYHKYANFNLLTDNNFIEGMKSLFESIQTDTRNLIFAFLLRPFWILFGKSFETYVLGILILFFIPAIYVLSFFINKFVLRNCEEAPCFKNISPFLLFSTPVFLYTLVIGYPDMLSIGLAISAIYFFFKANILEKTDWKMITTSSVLFFIAFLFRRWLFFVWICFLLTSAVFYTFKIATIKNNSYKEKLKKFIYLIKNTVISGIIFFALLAILANNVLQDMFNPQFRQLFQDYAISFSQNFNNNISKWGNNCIYAVLIIYALCFTETSREIKNFLLKLKNNADDKENSQVQTNSDYYNNLKKRNDLFSFFFLYSIIFFFLFASINIFGYDHTMWLILCVFICFIIALYSIIAVLPFKKLFAIIVLFLSFANLFYSCSDNSKIKDFALFQNLFIEKQIAPNKVPNLKILQETENIIREKYKQNQNYRYSMWCFWNDIYNPHLIFQSAYDTDLFNAGIFPPLVDTEAIVSNWYSFEIFKVDTIFVLEPIQSYLEGEEEKCKILSNTQELLKNKQGFASAFELKDKKFFGEHDGEKIYVLQYDRIRPVTKADQDDYYNRIIEWFPWAEEYFPDYFKNSWKNKD